MRISLSCRIEGVYVSAAQTNDSFNMWPPLLDLPAGLNYDPLGNFITGISPLVSRSALFALGPNDLSILGGPIYVLLLVSLLVQIATYADRHAKNDTMPSHRALEALATLGLLRGNPLLTHPEVTHTKN
jgi:hypothetical protein